MQPTDKIQLTQTVQKGGCAAKIPARELRQILSQVRFPPSHPDLLVDGGLFDDAAIFKVTEEVALVQTLDFFTPILDSPGLFGAVAATNALSDVYAMGGRPKTAMGILIFPMGQLPNELIIEMMQAASDKIAEAQAHFVGGHSIDDETLKFGLSVTGYVHPQKIWSNAGAQRGDHLLLTKPLGTGTLTAALKRREATEEDIGEAIASMMQLNNAVDLLTADQLTHVHAATDITGFGFSGHSMQMAKASQKTFQIQFSRLPVFQRAAEFIEKGFLTKAHRSNDLYTQESLQTSNLNDLQKKILHDPQTSGGLLLSVSASASHGILESLRKKFIQAEKIGEVLAPAAHQVIFES